ncbi:MAG: acetyl-CoA carboxylase biotin carboxyl carrier protein [Clostridia bacterium]|nr:acetyl-CoA carboxylase biotin carboxyl carrier protein [Clostridia bacterium]
MNEKDIRKYAGLMQELGLTGLEITEDNKVVRLERTTPQVVRETVAVNSAPAQPVSVADVPVSTDYISVKSPIVGVFYSAPAENADPYVNIGDKVKKGQTLCIVEAMKLMNEIACEEDGEILEICVTNGQVVEFGTELFRIKR